MQSSDHLVPQASLVVVPTESELSPSARPQLKHERRALPEVSPSLMRANDSGLVEQSVNVEHSMQGALRSEPGRLSEPSHWRTIMRSAMGWRAELRLAFIEMLITMIWMCMTLLSVGVADSCLEQCAHHAWTVRAVPPSTSNASMSSAMTPMQSSMCPPPTEPIIVALGSGFTAAVGCGLSFSAASHEVRHAPTGGNFHPGVTLSLALRHHIPPVRLVLYVLAQLAGAALGSWLPWLILGDACTDATIELHQEPRISAGGALLLQVVLNTTLCLLYLWADRRNRFMAFPILVGFSYAAFFLTSHPLLGLCTLNPLRSLGQTAGGGDGGLMPVWLGALLGALLAAMADKGLHARTMWGIPVGLTRPAMHPSVSTSSVRVERVRGGE